MTIYKSHLKQVVSRGCGMDIHKKVVVATV